MKRAHAPAGAWAVAAVAAVAAVVAIVLDRGAAPFAALGVSAPDVTIRVAGVLVRVGALLAGAVCLGGVVAACVVLPCRGGARELSARGYAATRTAGAAGAVWALTSSAAVPLTVLAGTGGDPRVLSDPSLFLPAMGAVQEPIGFLVAAVAAAVVAVMCRVTFSWRTAAAAVPLAALATVAPVVSGFAASVATDHDIVTALAMLAAPATAVGLGVAVVTTRYAPAHGADTAVVADRERRVLCWAVVAATAATLLTGPWLVAGAWSGRYGLLTLAQAVLLLVATAGVLARVRGGRALAVGGLASSLVVAALLATDSPPGVGRPASPQQTLLGYDLPGPVSALRLLAPGRVDVLLDLAALLLAAGYLAALWRLRRRGESWPAGRTASWLSGCALLAWTVSGGLGEYAMAMFSAHMGAHMLLAMVVPVLLVLGGPVSLALRVLPPPGQDAPDGARAWLLSVTGSPAARVSTHPLVSLVAFVGSFYALYLLPIFSAMLPFHWAHELLYVLVVAIGYLFFWPIIGIDDAPRPLPHVARLGLLLASMPFHVFLGVLLMGTGTPIGQRFYGDLALPWVRDLLADQTLGGTVALAAAEVPLLAVVIVLLVQWSRHDGRLAERHGRRAARDGDAELAAWDAMLADMARRRG